MRVRVWGAVYWREKPARVMLPYLLLSGTGSGAFFVFLRDDIGEVIVARVSVATQVTTDCIINIGTAKKKNRKSRIDFTIDLPSTS